MKWRYYPMHFGVPEIPSAPERQSSMDIVSQIACNCFRLIIKSEDAISLNVALQHCRSLNWIETTSDSAEPA